MYSFRIKEDQHYIISSARDDDDDDDVGGVDIVAKSQRHQELRRSAFCTSCNLQEVSAHKQHQVRLNIQLYPPDASDIDVNTKIKFNQNNHNKTKQQQLYRHYYALKYEQKVQQSHKLTTIL